jgi:hypothetical protein
MFVKASVRLAAPETVIVSGTAVAEVTSVTGVPVVFGDSLLSPMHPTARNTLNNTSRRSNFFLIISLYIISDFAFILRRDYFI